MAIRRHTEGSSGAAPLNLNLGYISSHIMAHYKPSVQQTHPHSIQSHRVSALSLSLSLSGQMARSRTWRFERNPASNKLKPMERSLSGELNSSLASQDSPAVRHPAHKTPPLVYPLSHTNSLHALPSCFFKMHFNIIMRSMSISFSLSLPLRLPTKILVYISLLPHTHVPKLCPSQQHKSWNSLLYSFSILLSLPPS